MAIRGQEVELLGDGIRADSPTKGAFALNMLYRRNSWEVRRGFGQVTELDTTMRAGRQGTFNDKWGYVDHLGSYGMITSFGHEQIVSAFTAKVWSGDRTFTNTVGATTQHLTNQQLSAWIQIYVVSIYDLTTGDRWEEPIFRHTAEFGKTTTSALEMPDWHGNYESWWRTDVSLQPTAPPIYGQDAPSSFLEDRQDWVVVSERGQEFFFTELDDILYLGNDDTGLLAYIPSIFRGRRRGKNGLSRLGRDKQAYSVYDRSWAPPYSESSVVINAVASDGPFSDGITYLTKSEFPAPSCAGHIGGRLVLSEGRTLYFSDVGYPTSIAADNVVVVPSEGEVTAMVEHGGNLIVFTDTETWYYQPSSGFVVSAGRLVRIAEGIGCLGSGAIVKDADLVWMDKRGVYAMTGNLTPRKVSEPIEPFFNDYISNPVTDYFVANGELPNPVPDQTAIGIRRVGSPVGAYSRELQCVLFSIPERNVMLCFGEGGWSVWSTETMVTNPDPAVVGSTANIERPWPVAFDSGLYLVGSLPPDQEGEVMDTNLFPILGDIKSRSYYILEYGRGGGIDRSVEAVEDYRQVRGFWRSTHEDSTTLAPVNSDHYIYAGKPIPIPQGMGIGDLSTPANVSPTTDAVDGAVWVPIDMVLGYRNSVNGFVRGDHPNKIVITMSYDNANWAPIPTAIVSSDVQFFLPPERVPSRLAWTVTDATPNITITFDPVGIPASLNTWTFYPILALQHRQLNRLVYIPFKPTTTTTTIGPKLQITSATIEQTSRPGACDLRAFFWDQTNLLAQRHEDNDVAQAVDWAYKSGPVGTEDGVQVKGRGLYMDVVSRGTAAPTHRLHENWPFGLLNILSAPDAKGWSSQVIDVASPQPPPATGPVYPASVTNASSKNTIRTRYARNTTTALTDNTFNTTNGPVYGTPGAGMGASNAELVGDEELSQLAVSDSVRGQSFTYMVWGSIQNKAERIVLGSVKAVMRVLGGKHRRGR